MRLTALHQVSRLPRLYRRESAMSATATLTLPSLRHDWTQAEVEALMDLPFTELLYRAASLHRRPAHQAALRYTVVTPVGPARAYGRVVMTATPGLTWTISCSGQGTTAEEAERNFAFWGLEIDALVASFRFTPAAPQPAPAAAPATTPDKK